MIDSLAKVGLVILLFALIPITIGVWLLVIDEIRGRK